jgi:hypothetical protein
MDPAAELCAAVRAPLLKAARVRRGQLSPRLAALLALSVAAAAEHAGEEAEAEARKALTAAVEQLRAAAELAAAAAATAATAGSEQTRMARSRMAIDPHAEKSGRGAGVLTGAAGGRVV